MFRSNKLNLIMAIVAAIAIWVYVVTAVNPTTEKTIRNIPVKLVHVEALTANGLTVSPLQAFTVDVELKGSRSDLSNIDESEITATADMTGFPVGENTVDVLVSVPEDMEVVAIHPDKIAVIVEELVSVTMPITLTYSDKFKEDVEPGFITVSPQEISVSGTKEMVDDIATVNARIENDSLSYDDETVTANIEAYAKSGDIVYGVMFSQDEVDVTARLCHTKEVPLKINVIGEPKGGRAVTSMDIPKTVTVRGSEDALKDINEITGRDIDISGIKETTIFTPDLNLSDDVEIADASSGMTVTVEIAGIEAKNIALTSDIIEIVGVPKDYSAHINTGNISVTIYGSKDQIAKFKTDEIEAYIDLSEANLSEGVYEALVQFKNDGGISRIECEPKSVHVTIVKTTTGVATVVKITKG